MPQISLEAAPRTDFGKGAARRLRRAGQVPAVVYGQGNELLHVSVDAHTLAQALKQKNLVIDLTGAGKGAKVAPREIQRDAVTQVLEHVDFVVLTADEVKSRQA